MAASSLAFKGIALFTPGGDVVYCVDRQKQAHWHIHLCEALQHLLGLAEVPHFLVPCYTATLDRSVDLNTQQVSDVAEASPLVLRYQPLLNAVFETTGLIWRPAFPQSNLCDPIVLATYRSQFPQLWQPHELVVQYEQVARALQPQPLALKATATAIAAHGYVLRLFVSGHSVATQTIMQTLHQLLEETLTQPYTLKVIDVSQHPEQAELDHVTATPTLVRAYPLPPRRIVGNLNTVDQLLSVLQLPNERDS